MKPYFTIGQNKKLFNVDCLLLLDWIFETGLKIDLFIFSPPYNLGKKRTRDDGQRKKGKYDACSHGGPDYPDNFPESVWQAQLINVLKHCASVLNINGSIICNMKPKRVDDPLSGDRVEQSTDEWLVPALSGDLFKHKKLILDREDTHNHEPSLPYSTYEEATIFKKSKSEPYYNNELAISIDNTIKRFSDTKKFLEKNIDYKNLDDPRITKIFTNNRDIIPFPPVRTKEPHHSAPFSLHFAREQIFRWCPQGGLVCDPYSGGGTTMLACCYEKRGFIGSELVENSCKMTKERILKEINDIEKNYNTIKTY